MHRFFDRSRRFAGILLIAFAVLPAIAVVAFALSRTWVHAQTGIATSPWEAQPAARAAELEKVNQELEQTKNQLNSIQNQRSSLQKQVQSLDTTVRQLNLDIKKDQITSAT